MANERLQKIISQSGIASRRKAEEMIERGRVSVNGVPVTNLGAQADFAVDQIAIDGKVISKPERVTYIVYKPRGVVTSRAAQGDTPIIMDLVPAEPPVYPVGRLDKDSEGLIVLTNDGDLAQKLTHPSFEHSKQYELEIAWVQKNSGKEPSVEDLYARIRDGVTLEDGVLIPDAVRLREEKNHRHLTITIHEGRNRLLRRLCGKLGYTVITLKRTSIGKFRDSRLQPGESRKMSHSEIQLLTA